MEQKAKVLIVDDNLQVREALRGALNDMEEVTVVGEAINGVQALEMTDTFTPDIVLLDIVMPQLDGFGVLEAYCRRTVKPTVIVISALAQEAFVQRAMELGAAYFIAKPFDFISLKNRICECMGKSVRVRTERQVSRAMERSLDEKISTVFITIGIPAHIKGYVFLREAVKMVIANQDIINRITKELYPGIARTFETSPSKVERAIRHAIEVAWTRGKIENINEIFGYNVYNRNDKPTNGEFIALIADKLLLEKVA